MFKKYTNLILLEYVFAECAKMLHTKNAHLLNLPNYGCKNAYLLNTYFDSHKNSHLLFYTKTHKLY